MPNCDHVRRPCLETSWPRVLFHFQDGTPMSRTRLCQEPRQALTAAGIDTAGYSGHSFHIGVATTATQAGFSNSLIQALGRWKSSAFQEYIRTDTATLTSISAKLAGGPSSRGLSLYVHLVNTPL